MFLRRFVFIRDYELKRTFVKTPVVTGEQNDKFIEIVEGLLPGDEVVVKGAYALASAGKGEVSLKEALDLLATPGASNANVPATSQDRHRH